MSCGHVVMWLCGSCGVAPIIGLTIVCQVGPGCVYMSIYPSPGPTALCANVKLFAHAYLIYGIMRVGSTGTLREDYRHDPTLAVCSERRTKIAPSRILSMTNSIRLRVAADS